jgi:ribonuclease P protein component
MRHSGDFARTIRSGSRAGGHHVVVHLLLPDPERDDPTPAEPARVGFVVSKAVGNAVRRNLVKRRLREIVTHQLSEIPDGALAVVRALPPSQGASHAELRDAVVRSIDVAMRRARRSRA